MNDVIIKHTKKIPIIAGMKFKYPGIEDIRLREVGYKIIEFTLSDNNMLINEREIKRVFYK